MTIRSVRHLVGPSARATQLLGTVLDEGRRATVHRAGLPMASACWNVAETRAATAVARADALAETSADARVLLATMIATIAHDGLDDLPCSSPLARHPALTAVDTASIAGWLRGLSPLLDGTDEPPLLLEEACRVARAVLDHPETTGDLLADAWLTVCGLPLLEVAVAGGSAPTCGSDAEVRLIQRSVASTLTRRGVVRPARIALVTGVDRATLVDWLSYGPPSLECVGHRVTAPTCAALTGVTAAQWRALNELGAVPAARTIGGSLTWDEAQVVRWSRGHGANDCQHQCPAHRHAAASIVVGMAGSPTSEASAGGASTARPALRLVP